MLVRFLFFILFYHTLILKPVQKSLDGYVLVQRRGGRIRWSSIVWPIEYENWRSSKYVSH